MSRLDALQDALAAEHAALFVVGYLGAQTSAGDEPELFAALEGSYAAHRALRDELAVLVREEGAEPVAAAPVYELPDLSGDPVAVRRRALGVERACAAAHGFLVASSTAAQRFFALDALVATALRELTLGGEPSAFPGR